jgi:hypothetical protein
MPNAKARASMAALKAETNDVIASSIVHFHVEH